MVQTVLFAVVQRRARVRTSQRHVVSCASSAGVPPLLKPRIAILGKQREHLPPAATRLYVGLSVVVWKRPAPCAALHAHAPCSPKRVVVEKNDEGKTLSRSVGHLNFMTRSSSGAVIQGQRHECGGAWNSASDDATTRLPRGHVLVLSATPLPTAALCVTVTQLSSSDNFSPWLSISLHPSTLSVECKIVGPAHDG